MCDCMQNHQWRLSYILNFENRFPIDINKNVSDMKSRFHSYSHSFISLIPKNRKLWKHSWNRHIRLQLLAKKFCVKRCCSLMLSNFYTSVSITSLCFEKLQLIFLILHLYNMFNFFFCFKKNKSKRRNNKWQDSSNCLKENRATNYFSAVGNHAFFRT